MDLNSLRSKVRQTLDKTDLDEKVGAAAKQMKGKVQDVLSSTDLPSRMTTTVSMPGTGSPSCCKRT